MFDELVYTGPKPVRYLLVTIVNRRLFNYLYYWANEFLANFNHRSNYVATFFWGMLLWLLSQFQNFQCELIKRLQLSQEIKVVNKNIVPRNSKYLLTIKESLSVCTVYILPTWWIRMQWNDKLKSQSIKLRQIFLSLFFLQEAYSSFLFRSWISIY